MSQKPKNNRYLHSLLPRIRIFIDDVMQSSLFVGLKLLMMDWPDRWNHLQKVLERNGPFAHEEFNPSPEVLFLQLVLSMNNKSI